MIRCQNNIWTRARLTSNCHQNPLSVGSSQEEPERWADGPRTTSEYRRGEDSKRRRESTRGNERLAHCPSRAYTGEHDSFSDLRPMSLCHLKSELLYSADLRHYSRLPDSFSLTPTNQENTRVAAQNLRDSVASSRERRKKVAD